MRFPSYLSDIRELLPYRYGVSRIGPILPKLPPHIRFLFVRLMVCYRLPSSVRYLPDSVELLVLPPIGRTVDFHHINTRALLGAHRVESALADTPSHTARPSVIEPRTCRSASGGF